MDKIFYSFVYFNPTGGLMVDYFAIKQMLEKEGQPQLLRCYDALSDGERETFLSEISRIDFSFFNRAEHSKRIRSCDISPLDIFTSHMAEQRREELEAAGLAAIGEGRIAAVLLCGGQGTRLGFDHSKGMYDIGLTRPLSIFELHFSYMLGVAKRAGTWFPIFIMTSEINDSEIREFLAAHDYFGYNGEFVHFYVQNMVPSTDLDGKILMGGRASLAMSPDGNGGWFSSLVSAGLLDFVKTSGVEWFNVVSIDNVLQRTVDPLFVGATLCSGADCGAKVIKKATPDERIGLICQNAGHPSVIEYYELDRLIREENVNTDGIEYGVILNYLFRTDRMEGTLSHPLPVHKVRKKIPYFDDGELIVPEWENGYKYEMLATDLVEFMGSCLPYEVRREAEFAPVKNRDGADSVDSAREMLMAAGYTL